MRRWRCGRAGVPEGMDGSVSTELILLAVLVVGVFLLLVFVLLLLVRTAVTNSDRLVGTVNRLVEKSEDAFLAIQTGNERKLAEIQASNEQRLDAMRQLVDEKLQSTLEQRLGESFRLVGERLRPCSAAWARCRRWPTASAT